MRRIIKIALSGLLTGSLAGALSACSAKMVHDSEAAAEAPKAPANDTEAEQSLKEWQVKRQKTYFDWPVDDARMTRGFLPNRRHPHKGIDLAAKKNTPILASHDGTVIYVGHDFRGFGKMVMIEGDKGWATLYAHLNKIDVREGQKVKQGQVIAAMGRTGHATGVHLHFEIRKISGPVDPLVYLPGGSRLANNH
jgi:murein DD-endopeptidase MepM/ murein hydrolase activator NlpD